MLRLCGADLRLVPAVPYKDPNNYVKFSGRLAAELDRTLPDGAVWANQFDNTANRQAHVEGTGPEIWRQTGGRIDGFTCAIGTGGTLAGVAIALKERDPKVQVWATDPQGAGMISLLAPRQGAAGGRVDYRGHRPGAHHRQRRGRAHRRRAAGGRRRGAGGSVRARREEGLVMGGSTGVNVAGAIRMAEAMGPGHTVVTVLCDSGSRYTSKLFNPAFLRSRNLPVPPWLEKAPA